jgi:uncharacterized GH25 family protein
MSPQKDTEPEFQSPAREEENVHHNCKNKPIPEKGKLVTVEFKHGFWDFNFSGQERWRVVTRRWSDLENKLNFDEEHDVEKSADGNFHCPFCHEVLT